MAALIIELLKKIADIRLPEINIFVGLKEVPAWVYAGLLFCCLVIGVLWASPELRKIIYDREPPPKSDTAKKKVRTAKNMDDPKGQRRVEPPCSAASAQDQAGAQAFKGFRAAPASIEWKCLQYGLLYRDPASAINAVARTHITVTAEARDVLRQSINAPIPNEAWVSAALVRLIDLNLFDPATLPEVIARAGTYGLKPFPAPAIPAAAMAYSDTRKYFFGVRLRPRAVMYVGRPDDGPDRDHLDLIDWQESSVQQRTFDPHATFLFARREPR